MTAPIGADSTVTYNEYTDYTFSAEDFGYSDVDGDEMLGIIVSRADGNVMFGNSSVLWDVSEKFIAIEDLGQLRAEFFWGHQRIFEFKVVSEGGSVDTVSEETYTMDVDVIDLVETFRGTRRDDGIYCTRGIDIVDGRGGNDNLHGRGSSDTFIFSTGYDRDVIFDARLDVPKHDVIDVSDLRSVKNFADLMRNHARQDGKHVLIDGGNGDELFLKGTNLGELDKGDFLF